MDTSIFKYGELPEFKKFTPENISKQFPVVLEKIDEDFKNIEKNLSNYLIHNDLANYIIPLGALGGPGRAPWLPQGVLIPGVFQQWMRLVFQL